MATINDVARKCGVSLTTVSLVLNKRNHAISTRTQERVFAAARELNYHPSALARGLMKQGVQVIGVVFNTVEPAIVTNPYATGILSGIFWAASRAGYQVLLFTTPWEGAEKSAAPFRDGRTDGLIIVAPPEESDIVTALANLGLPVVVVSAPSNVAAIASLDLDNRQAGKIVAEHLLALGHTKIAQVMGLPDQLSVRDRRDGCLAALTSAGITPPSEYLVTTDWQRGDVQTKTRQLLALPDPPTAVFCSNDDLAVYVCQTAQNMGLRVPQDVSVAGCDDYPAATLITPHLTTIRHPLMEIAHRATAKLIRRIETPANGEETTHRVFAAELIVRGSTAHPPK